MLRRPDPETYDSWYRGDRGSWIGNAEYRLIRGRLAPRPAETILDAGCGTGYFSRCLRQDGFRVTGFDLDRAAARFASASCQPPLPVVVGDLRALPFADRSFDCVISIAALCFVDDERRVLKEILRVARRRFALGLLNRDSLLYRAKADDSGSYAGARWHDHKSIYHLMEGMRVCDLRLGTAVFLPSAGPWARLFERIAPAALPWGSFIAVSGSIDSR